MTHEYQKPFTEVGRLNAELVTRKAYHGILEGEGWCRCPVCQEARIEIGRKVNKLMGRKFYVDV